MSGGHGARSLARAESDAESGKFRLFGMGTGIFEGRCIQLVAVHVRMSSVGLLLLVSLGIRHQASRGNGHCLVLATRTS